MYQGPTVFQRIVNAEWTRMEQNTTRKEAPSIIVGGIDTIASDDRKITILGDYQKSEEIDGLWEGTRTEPSEITQTIQDLMATCKEGNIKELEGEIPRVALYNPSLDVVLVSSEAVAIYMLANAVGTIYSIRRDETHKVGLISEGFEYQLAEGFVAREFGDTAYSRCLQKALLEGKPEFSKERQGRYAFDKIKIDRRVAGNIDTAVLTVKKRLEIQKLEIISAAIGARRLLALPIEPEESDTDLIRMLKNKADQLSPKDFFIYCKGIAEHAYERRKQITQLLEQGEIT